MAKIKRLEWRLTPTDEVHLAMTIAGGAVIDFGINYRAVVGGRWVSVLRVDTSHGPPHVHKFWRSPADQTEPLRAVSASSGDYAVVIEAVRTDLRANWKRYRTLMEAAAQ